MALTSYFTPEINRSIAEVTDDQMWDTLRRLEESEYWFAILKYNNKRLLVAQSLVNSLDPVKEPTSIGRTQGVMTGIVDLQNAVIQLVEAEKVAADEAERIRTQFGS